MIVGWIVEMGMIPEGFEGRVVGCWVGFRVGCLVGCLLDSNELKGFMRKEKVAKAKGVDE